MKPLTFGLSNFFSCLIFHPDQGKEEEDRRNAWIATIVLGILTGGMVHLACGIYQLGCYFHDKWVEKRNTENLNSEDKKVQNVAISFLDGQKNADDKDKSPEQTCDVVKTEVSIQEQENIDRNEMPINYVFHGASVAWANSMNPSIEALLKKMPPAYYCIQIWGGARKQSAIEEGLQDLKEKFSGENGQFKDKLPVVMIIFRNSANEKVVQCPFDPNVLLNMGVCCAVTMNAHQGKIIEEGEDYRRAIQQIKEKCNSWQAPL
jgi:hypothetical protein